MIETLHWNLTRTATRQHLLDEVVVHLSSLQRDELDSKMNALSWENEHFHDKAAVDCAIDGASLAPGVCADAKAVYDILAAAEAKVHGVPIEETHFHEVGEGDAVANVIAICLAIAVLSPERITATSVQVGEGKIHCAHGILAIPAPATAAIIARGIPICPEKLPGERCTPTSAALIAHFVQDFD